MLDAVVIGGGPSGSASAVRLAQAGMKVALFEKSKLPRRKLCGGFLSAESLPELQSLGVLERLRAAGAWPVDRLVVASPGGVQATTALSKPALAVSRSLLDSLLLDQARASGVDVFEGTDGFAHIRDGRWTVVACGRTPLPRKKIEGPKYYGIQALFEDVPTVTDQIELDFISGAYMGWVRVEKHRVNLCALVGQDYLQRWGHDLDRMFREFMTMNPCLMKHMKNARRLNAWMAVGPSITGFRKLHEDGTFFIGDAACVVDPFVGEGMAMGLVGSRWLAEALTQEAVAPALLYQKLWHRSFDRPRQIQNLLHKMLHRPVLQEMIVRFSGAFPSVLGWLAERTRPSLA